MSCQEKDEWDSSERNKHRPVFFHEQSLPVKSSRFQGRPDPSELEREARNSVAIAVVVTAELSSKVVFLRQRDRDVGNQKEDSPDGDRDERIRSDDSSKDTEIIPDVEGIAAVLEHAASDETFGIDLAIPSASHDVVETDCDGSYDLPDEDESDPDESSDPPVGKYIPRWDQ